MKKINGHYLIQGKEFKGINDIAIYYGLKDYYINNQLNSGETLNDILGLSGYIEEDFNKSDIEYIKKNNLKQDYDYREIFTILTNRQREFIRRKLVKGWDVNLIYTNSNMLLKDIKEYVFIYKSKEIIDGQKYCPQCKKKKYIKEFLLNKGKREAICSRCYNDRRSDKMHNDINYRNKMLESKRISERKRKKKTISEMTTEELEHVREIRKKSYNRRMDKKMKDKIIKTRLINNNKLGIE